MIEKIVEHIRKKDKTFDDYRYGTDLSAILKYYYFNKLGWCGCGCPEEAMLSIAKYLEAVSHKYPENKEKLNEYFPPNGYENPLVLCLAYEMDRAGFTDHGSSVYGCWLTNDGKYFLWTIKEAERQDELEVLDV